MKTSVGIIGGSGLYDMEGLVGIREERVETPFGSPSDIIITGELAGKRVAFLPRHGKGHRFLPSEVNYRANIYALKMLGVTHIVSVSAVGSLQERHAPGMVVIPTQILDRTTGVRERTFFGKGIVGHVSLADPYCPSLQAAVHAAARAEIPTAHLGGTYVCVEGPRFSSRAESHSYRALDADIIGMTAMPEAILAREAELPYATLAFVTDYDCWKDHEEAVSVEAVMAVLKKNVDASKRIVRSIVEGLPAEGGANPIFDAAKYAIMTPHELIPHETKRALDPLYGKYWR
jgi:5'-methylthioadenosine phosphorylase